MLKSFINMQSYFGLSNFRKCKNIYFSVNGILRTSSSYLTDCCIINQICINQRVQLHMYFWKFHPVHVWHLTSVQSVSKRYSTYKPTYKNKINAENYISEQTSSSPVKQDSLSLKNETELKKWLDLYRFSGGNVPESIKEKHMDMLLEKYKLSTHQAIKYLNFLFINEIKRKKGAASKLERKEISEQKHLEFITDVQKNDHIMYRLWNNSMYGRVFKGAINNLDYHRMKTALHFGQPLIIDLGFDNRLQSREFSSLCKQLQICIKDNMTNTDPFNLHLCNLNEEKLSSVKEYVHVLKDPALPMNITNKSYLDLFPKDKLVYLTPDSKYVMNEFDYDAIYIIGGIVDLGTKKPLTLAKAKKEGIKTMKLPLNKYLEFKNKPPLGIHIIMAILLELQACGDFEKALSYIPKRLLADPDTKFGESSWDQKRIHSRLSKL